MRLLTLAAYLLLSLGAASELAAQDLYSDFALVVQLPSYETFLTNLGDAPLRVDGYQIASQSGSLSTSGWLRMGSAGAAIVAALGPGADQFFAANPNPNHLAELNPIGSATWQPGQSWSLGFPFNTADLDLIRQTSFQFSSPDGFVSAGGTVVPPSQLSGAALLIVPEPSCGMLCLFAAAGIVAFSLRRVFVGAGQNNSAIGWP